VTGAGFLPGESVTAVMSSETYTIGTKAADANGSVSFTWDLPTGTSAGSHQVTLTGAQSGSVSQTITVASDGTLATTGSAVSGLMAGLSLLCLIGGGAGLAVASKLRRQTRLARL